MCRPPGASCQAVCGISIVPRRSCHQGGFAGWSPRVLEHMVDCVLYFEGDSGSSFRLVRAIKNRFGAVNEIGVFAMTAHRGFGMSPIPRPCLSGATVRTSRAAWCSRHRRAAARLLVEVQALVDDSALGQSEAPLPRPRTESPRHAIWRSRIATLGISLNSYDVFANVAGGVRDNGNRRSDLALLLAILSSVKQPCPLAVIWWYSERSVCPVRTAPGAAWYGPAQGST